MINTEANLKLTGDQMALNTYSIHWNDLFGEWHVTHDIAGLTPFKDFQEAIDYAKKG